MDKTTAEQELPVILANIKNIHEILSTISTTDENDAERINDGKAFLEFLFNDIVKQYETATGDTSNE